MQYLLYFRLALIPVHAICAYHAYSIPNPAPPETGRNKYRSRNKAFIGEKGLEMTHAVTTLKYMTWAEDFLELAILVTTIASLPLLSLLQLSPHQLSACTVQLIGVISFIVGTLIRVSAYRHLGRFFTIQLAVSDGHKLVKDGPYGIVRHPAYIGGVMVLFGDVWCQLGPASIWTQVGLWGHPVARCFGIIQVCIAGYIFLVSLLVRVEKEDQVLKREFKEEWEVWARQTPYKLIPYVY